MEELIESIKNIHRLLVCWIDFGLILLNVAIGIPIIVAVTLVLISVPFLYLAVAFSAPLSATLYLLAVFAGVATYCISTYRSGEDREFPDDGRPITTEDKADRRGRSMIRDFRIDR